SAPWQGSPACPVQAPATHVSVPLQNALSLHDVPFGSLFGWHVPEPSQVSPLSHTSSLLLPHGVVAGSRLVLQVPEPSQLSAWLQSFSVPLPHGVSMTADASAGHAPVPSQISTAPRQTVVDGATPSAGHAASAPVQVSA